MVVNEYEWVVPFQADGGQAPCYGQRVFPDTPEGRDAAMAFKRWTRERDMTWHTAMRLVARGSERDMGLPYPLVANMGRVNW